MTKPTSDPAATTVPKQVFGKFLQSLPATGIQADIVERLRAVLLNDAPLREDKIRSAIFPEDDTP